ncbi:gamma-carboxymuconolactone decarboxylase [Methylobacterium radiotolerans]|jgi:alkylhydroperoxidase/carboxymuconolactone decarboxylase family protein YurZ|uniref:carboxymuconolactone decarboxylase family protein n=1 Tax=Methylobacterium TaxID=407 RepID=UPI0005E8EF55|nr:MULTISPECIES: carboxymuconolactone decarboxylase family protein [Methylobacterium]MBN6818894.1 carboxymuconolactone decarboxylase family protein [Methylobacterium organophilum]OXE43079.1 gamma-carboxymuconolactone decarboxylase [Methylobacterium radiotolerans]PJI55278.1 gamma-carboxymuconolactone decarboxylase [Methylobacterium radiotolerans]GAN46570.1 carboxymuconolactone decarboxylase [Methylobacterium sp. ME121]
MTGTAPNPESLRHTVQGELGYWDPEQAALAELAPGFLDAWARLATVPVRKNHLGAKDRALIALSAATAATHLYAPGTRRQIRNALDAGATADEITEVLALTATLGIHACNIGVPLLLEVLEEAGQRSGPAPLTPRQEQLRSDFTRDRGYWHTFWDGLLELDPDLFEGYLDFSAWPWRHGVLTPKMKEFVYCAFDAAATHLYVPGLKMHMKNALGYGATKEELMEVLEIVSLIGMHGAELAAPILRDELEARGRG